jgi:hypothetical protein
LRGIAPRAELVQLFEKHHAGIGLSKQLFLQSLPFPIVPYGVVHAQHHRIEKSNHGEVSFSYIASFVTGGRAGPFDFLKVGFGSPPEGIHIRELLPASLQADNAGY